MILEHVCTYVKCNSCFKHLPALTSWNNKGKGKCNHHVLTKYDDCQYYKDPGINIYEDEDNWPGLSCHRVFGFPPSSFGLAFASIPSIIACPSFRLLSMNSAKSSQHFSLTWFTFETSSLWYSCWVYVVMPGFDWQQGIYALIMQIGFKFPR